MLEAVIGRLPEEGMFHPQSAQVSGKLVVAERTLDPRRAGGARCQPDVLPIAERPVEDIPATVPDPAHERLLPPVWLQPEYEPAQALGGCRFHLGRSMGVY